MLPLWWMVWGLTVPVKSYDSDDEFDDLDDPPGFWQEASQLSAVWEDSFDVLGAS